MTPRRSFGTHRPATSPSARSSRCRRWRPTTYLCSDGRWVAVTAGDDVDWRALCSVLGRPDLALDGRFAHQDGRRTHRSLIDAAVASWCAGRDAVTAMNVLQAGGVPAGVVQDASDLAVDPQLAARGFWRT